METKKEWMTAKELAKEYGRETRWVWRFAHSYSVGRKEVDGEKLYYAKAFADRPIRKMPKRGSKIARAKVALKATQRQLRRLPNGQTNGHNKADKLRWLLDGLEHGYMVPDEVRGRILALVEEK